MTLFDRVRAKLCPPPLSHRKEAGGEEEGEEKKTASLSSEWWVAAMGDILPSFSPLRYPTAFTVSPTLFFLLHCLDTFLSRFIHLSPSLNPSSHFSFTPLLLCLLFFHSLISLPPLSSLVLFCLLSVSFSPLFFSPLYAPPAIASFSVPPSLSPHTHTDTQAHAQ